MIETTETQTGQEATTPRPVLSGAKTCSTLPPVCWVHRPEELMYEIDESDDLCPVCCAVRVEKYKKEHPEHAEDITEDGGFETCREGENLSECEECGCHLGCYLFATWLNPDEWIDEERTVDTEKKWIAADAKIDW